MIALMLAWTGEEEDQDENHIWQDDWDDDTVEDDFSNQLRYMVWQCKWVLVLLKP